MSVSSTSRHPALAFCIVSPLSFGTVVALLILQFTIRASGSKRRKSDTHFILNDTNEATTRGGAASASDGSTRNTGEERSVFKCDKCNCTFRWRGNLKNHVLSVHEKKKNYACNQCDKSFAFKDGLLRHISTVHDNERKFFVRIVQPGSSKTRISKIISVAYTEPITKVDDNLVLTC